MNTITVYSLSALFEAYPFLNASALGEWMGINASMMRRYKSGLSSPRGKHKAVMQAKIQELSSRLAQIHF